MNNELCYYNITHFQAVLASPIEVSRETYFMQAAQFTEK